MSGKIQKIFRYFLILLFAVTITAPAIKMFSNPPRLWSDFEKRVLAPPPILPATVPDLVPFFSSIDSYLEDHFGFREFLLARYQREVEKRFGKTSIHERVIEGLDGYYFFNDFNLLQDYLGLLPLTDNQLREFIDHQHHKNEWLQSRGIRYIYAVAPNKQSVYPQFLMKNADRLKGRSRYEQYLDRVNSTPPAFQLNLHPLLQEHAKTQQLFYKNDSHWNKLAAYLVFREVMAKISDWFPQETFSLDFDFVDDETGIGGNTGQGGDLVRLIRRPGLIETYPQIKNFKRCGGYNYPLPYDLSNIPQRKGRPSFLRTCPKQKLRAVIFRDSFFIPLEPFFSENFEEVIYLWKEFDQRNIEEIIKIHKPDIVIEMVVERHAFDPFVNTPQQ